MRGFSQILRSGVAGAVLLSAGPLGAAALTGVTVTAAGSDVAVALTLSGPFDPPTTFAMDAPRRLVVDLPGVTTANRAVAGDGGVRLARVAQFSAATARVVIDLDAPMTVGGATLAGNVLTVTLRGADAAGFKTAIGKRRIKLPGLALADLLPEDRPAQVPPPAMSAAAPSPATALSSATTPSPVASRPAKPTAAKPEVRIAAVAPRLTPPAPKVSQPPALPPAEAAAVRQIAARIRSNYHPLVVIDPGHGGHDTGAVSVLDGKFEKDAVLAIGLKLRRELEDAGYRVMMTRSDDRFIPLIERVKMAQIAKGSLFISIHADSAPGSGATGASVYTLSEVASDREAARLAAKENKAGLLQGVNLSAASADVADILLDLTQRETMNVSAEFATTLEQQLRGDIPFKTQGHRFAGFVVLKAADVPSVLFETGYLSSLDDSKRLFSADGQRVIAHGIRDAVDAHFQRRLASR